MSLYLDTFIILIDLLRRVRIQKVSNCIGSFVITSYSIHYTKLYEGIAGVIVTVNEKKTEQELVEICKKYGATVLDLLL